MKHQELHWKTRDGLKIFGQLWKTDGPEKAIIALVHGFGEHSNRYHHVAEAFCDHNYSMIAMDHRGHGKSEGQRGHTPSYESLMQDIDILLEQAADHFPDTPVILYGHSMGGNIVTNYLLQRNQNVLAAVVTGPFYRTAEPPPAYQMALGKLMNKVWGAFPDKAKLDAHQISRDKAVVDKYVADPLVHNKISARMGLSLIEMGEYAIQHASDLDIPFYIIHGDADGLTDVDGSRAFAANSGENVKLNVLPGFYHEVHNDPGKEEILDNIIAWCDQQIPSPPTS